MKKFLTASIFVDKPYSSFTLIWMPVDCNCVLQRIFWTLIKKKQSDVDGTASVWLYPKWGHLYLAPPRYVQLFLCSLTRKKSWKHHIAGPLSGISGDTWWVLLKKENEFMISSFITTCSQFSNLTEMNLTLHILYIFIHLMYWTKDKRNRNHSV